MKHTYYPPIQNESLLCRAVMSIIGAVVLISVGVILLLAYFDVLVK